MDKRYWAYCPYCGQVESKDKADEIITSCKHCFTNKPLVNLPETQDYTYLVNLKGQLRRQTGKWLDMQEIIAALYHIYDDPRYDENLARQVKFMYSSSSNTYKTTETTHQPKCPTCGSTNVRHISDVERAGNAILFGVFGTKRKCQFECLNPQCGYRW